MARPTIYMIRHGEKPPKQADGRDTPGLSATGVRRAQALVEVFGARSNYNIKLVMAQRPRKNGHQARPSQTVTPLAEALGTAPNFDVDRDDIPGVLQAIREYTGDGNILICWEHRRMTEIARGLGVANAPGYPSDRFDVIWRIDPPYNRISSVASERCPGLDV